MKPIKCMLGMHLYSDASLEVRVVDERHGHLVCRVRNCCVNCGEAFEDIVSIPIPEWLNIDRTRMDGGENESNIYCDRNLCTQNEYNGIECDECQEKRKNEVEE